MRLVLGVGVLVVGVAVVAVLLARTGPAPATPEQAAERFVQALQRGDWGQAEALLTSHDRYRVGRDRYDEAARMFRDRVTVFTAYRIHDVQVKGDTAYARVRMTIPVEEYARRTSRDPVALRREVAQAGRQASHVVPGVVRDDVIIHAERLTLVRGTRGWKVRNFEEVDPGEAF
ncbi:MAG: hypothetical protein HY660_01480 [Armatimonadetes bacterium]|nr:hypothetical protein [Armatimonadota bacterium]